MREAFLETEKFLKKLNIGLHSRERRKLHPVKSNDLSASKSTHSDLIINKEFLHVVNFLNVSIEKTTYCYLFFMISVYSL